MRTRVYKRLFGENDERSKATLLYSVLIINELLLQY